MFGKVIFKKFFILTMVFLMIAVGINISAYRPGKAPGSTECLPEKVSAGTDAKDARQSTPPPAKTGVTPLAAGDILASWTPVEASWGICYDRNSNTVWVGSPGSSWEGTNTVYEYSLTGTKTGRQYPFSFSTSGNGPADFCYNWNTGMIWVVAVSSPDNAIYEINPASGPTGNSIAPAFSTSMRGLAYDPTDNTYFAGSWNDNSIHHFNSSGTILSSVNVGLGISGLAYNPTTQHMFVMVNAVPNYVYVLDVANSYNLLGSFSIAGFSDGSGAGMEFDCSGALWVVDQVNSHVVQVDSGETIGVCGPMARLSEHSFVDDCELGGAGDGDGVADAGESLQYTLTIQNYGVGDLTAVQATLSTATPGVTVTSPTVTYGTILEGASMASPSSFVVVLDPTMLCGDVIDFQLTINGTPDVRTKLEDTWVSTFQETVGSGGTMIPIINETFEAWPPTSGGTWTFSNTGCTGWNRGSYCERSNLTGGTGDFANADSDCCGSAMDAIMITPSFSLDGSYPSAQLQFKSDFNDYGGSDDGYVDISTDGGTTWINLFHYDKADFRGPRTETVDISSYIGNPDIRIRFEYIAPGYDWWWQIDDVVVSYEAPCEMNPCGEGGCPEIAISPATLPDATVGLAYNQTISASGGTAPYTYSVTMGSLPTGLTLNSSTGVLSGTPTAGGTFTFTVTATDNEGCTGTATYTISFDYGWNMSVYDDAGRAGVCLNTETGYFAWTALMGVGAGTYVGRSDVSFVNNCYYFISTLPMSMNMKVNLSTNRASGAFMRSPMRERSIAIDSNITDNPSCGGGETK